MSSPGFCLMPTEETSGERRAAFAQRGEARAGRAVAWLIVALLIAGWCLACGQTPPPRAPSANEPAVKSPAPRSTARTAREPAAPIAEPAEPALAEAQAEVEPVPLTGPDQVLVFRGGEVEVIPLSEAAGAGLFVLDLGSEWVPSLFRSSINLPHDYERPFIELANGRFPDTTEGRRAAYERYLEPHGIPPSPALLARRFGTLAAKPCSTTLALKPLEELAPVAWDDAKSPPAVPAAAIEALQARLLCEGHLRVKPSGELDDKTRRALEEFERRNRIYAHHNLKGESLEALRAEPLELERRTLLRVLSERMVLDLGVIEDGSAIGAVHSRHRNDVEDAPDVVRRIERRVLEAFALQTVEGVARFYRKLAAVLDAPHYWVAIDSVELPSYYRGDMDMWVEVDRGDFFYEFPFDENGKPLGYRIERGPTLTLFAQDGEQVRPLALYQTTIGGWRVRRHGDEVSWEYKQSPVGLRAWRRIVTAPVWLPPPSTLSETLVVKMRRTSDNSEFYELNRNLIGPSFGSAYGLAAAYHQRAVRGKGGTLELGKDDGIRTHGSSDYTSIWRTVSSGCHRLHNHLATRLFNFILAHRAHRRIGHLSASYRMQVSTPEFQDRIEVSRTGYEFDLDPPLEVRVLPGRIRGQLKNPLRQRVPAPAEEAERPSVVLTPLGTGPS
jgi:hypothetical protein